MIETFAIDASVVISRKPSSRTIGSRTRLAFASSPRGTVKLMSVAPPWPTFWTIMSTLIPCSASGAKTARATPGRSGTATSVTFATFRSWAIPADLVALLHERVLLDQRPGRLLEGAEDLDDDIVDPAELDGPDLHDLGALVGELQHLLVGDHGSCRASGTMRGSAV